MVPSAATRLRPADHLPRGRDLRKAVVSRLAEKPKKAASSTFAALVKPSVILHITYTHSMIYFDLGVDRSGEAAMQQSQNYGLSARVRQYQASKTVLFWSCAGSVILAVIVGFTWGGWVTGGSAGAMAEESAAQARQELASVVCVERFMTASDARAQLTSLQAATSSYERGKFVEDGGWALMVPASDAADRQAAAEHRKAAGLCAAELAKHEVPATGEAALINDEAPVAQ